MRFWYCIWPLQRAQVVDSGAAVPFDAHVLPQACRHGASEDEVVSGLVAVVTQGAGSICDDKFLEQVAAALNPILD